MIIEIDCAKFKRCSRCGILKSIDEFHNSSSSSDRLSCYCKKCKTAKNLEKKKTKRIKRNIKNIEYLPKEKKCTKCGKIKQQSEFNLHSKSLDGLAWRCMECAKKSQRESNLESIYGITQKQYNELLEKQNGICAICGKTPEDNGKALAVDHNHRTNVVRGLLCDKCNTGIGILQDSSKLLRTAADYLDN